MDYGTIPAKETLADNEVAIIVRPGERPDDLGRVQFRAFWLDSYLTPDGVCGQVFDTNVAGFVARNEARGEKITALDDHTRQILEMFR